jgi:small subunit ribosomal protein S6
MEENKKDNLEMQVYEIGYHLLPTVSEADVSLEVNKIKDLITAFSGNFISEGFPLMRQLAYGMIKKSESRNIIFSKAYFGWIKFEMEKERVSEFNKKIKSLDNILRFIIVKTVRENTMSVPKTPIFKKETKDELSSEELEEKAPVSEADLDKSIDDLVVG